MENDNSNLHQATNHRKFIKINELYQIIEKIGCFVLGNKALDEKSSVNILSLFSPSVHKLKMFLFTV